MSTSTTLATKCMRCGTASDPVAVASSGETIEMVDALRGRRWMVTDGLEVVLCPFCLDNSRNTHPRPPVEGRG